MARVPLLPLIMLAGLASSGPAPASETGSAGAPCNSLCRRWMGLEGGEARPGALRPAASLDLHPSQSATMAPTAAPQRLSSLQPRAKPAPRSHAARNIPAPRHDAGGPTARLAPAPGAVRPPAGAATPAGLAVLATIEVPPPLDPALDPAFRPIPGPAADESSAPAAAVIATLSVDRPRDDPPQPANVATRRAALPSATGIESLDFPPPLDVIAAVILRTPARIEHRVATVRDGTVALAP